MISTCAKHVICERAVDFFMLKCPWSQRDPVQEKALIRAEITNHVNGQLTFNELLEKISHIKIRYVESLLWFTQDYHDHDRLEFIEELIKYCWGNIINIRFAYTPVSYKFLISDWNGTPELKIKTNMNGMDYWSIDELYKEKDSQPGLSIRRSSTYPKYVHVLKQILQNYDNDFIFRINVLNELVNIGLLIKDCVGIIIHWLFLLSL